MFLLGQWLNYRELANGDKYTQGMALTSLSKSLL